MTEKTVLHIAAHMGGGVGKVLSNVVLGDKNYKHHIVLLEKPMDTQFTNVLTSSNITIAPSLDVIQELVRCSDIVQWDWWNHPLMAKTMYECRDIPMRSVIWSHTAGCYYPYIKPDFVLMPDRFIFSSQYSKDNPHWVSDLRMCKPPNVSVINSSGGFASTMSVPLVKHEGFNVGYIGTLGYMKLLPEFVEYCVEASDIPDIKFVMIGRIPNPNLILKQAEDAGIADKFVFKGWVDDLPSELAQLDVVGYLLNKYHFGTTENALLEAMSMGIPPVTMNQCAEKYIISNEQTGFLVRSKYEYKDVLSMLHKNAKYRSWVGYMARNHVLTHLNLDSTLRKLDNVYNEIIKVEKHQLDITGVIGNTPYKWYQSGLPPKSSKVFMQYLTDSTKGSVAQWHKYFPEDKELAQLVK